MAEKIPAITAWSRNFEPLFNRWSSTLPKDFVVCDKVIEVVQDGYGFQKQSWYDAISLKIQHFIDTLSTYPDGKIVLCCDCDIFFINQSSKLAECMIKRITEDNLDMLFMQEAQMPQVNGGFIVVKNSAKVQEVFKTARDYCLLKTPHADQDYFNSEEFQERSGIRWGFIDYNLVAWGNNIYDNKTTLFHHAVCASGLKEKLQQQDRIAQRFGIKLN